jgi:hypothetical protein
LSGGSIAAAFWGVAEATLFFVVPDVLVGWLALRRPRWMLASWLAATVGGIVGAALVHTAVRKGWDPDPVYRALPGTQIGDIRRVRAAIADDSTRAFAMGAISGVPVKIYVAEAARAQLPLRRTLLLVAINRAPRIGVSGLVAAIVGTATPRTGLGSSATGAIYALGWVVFYAWYWVVRNDPDAIVDERDFSEPDHGSVAVPESLDRCGR